MAMFRSCEVSTSKARVASAAKNGGKRPDFNETGGGAASIITLWFLVTKILVTTAVVK